MTKADELWRECCGVSKGDDSGPMLITKYSFKAALSEYGELVQQKAAKKCRSHIGTPAGADTELVKQFYRGCEVCAAAIKQMELP